MPRGSGFSSIKQLASALFEARHDVEQIFHALANGLTASLCDGCVISLQPGAITLSPVTRERSERTGAVHTISVPLARGTELRGNVIATRDRGSRPFDDEDLAAIETCIEYASLAAESALQLERERNASRTERERTAQFQQEMLGIVGHDLRAPLGAILISTEILAADRKDDPSASHAITRIVSFANRMGRMVDQLLDLTRARLGGQIALARTQIRLLPILKSVIEDLTVTHAGSHFELVADDVKGIWDSDRLEQVMSNVLRNAVQFGLEGATINVRVTHEDGATKIAVHNAIRDQPIPPETLATLFEPYRRGWDREHVGTGLGLGLYIAHEIVRAHGGTIAAESSQSGTTLHVVLPDPAIS